jgi:hypothetical protein
MTLTVRSATVTGATTKGSALTHAELDENFNHLSQASNISVTQSGSGAVSKTVSSILDRFVMPEMFGTNTTPGTTDMQAAVLAASVAAVAQKKAVLFTDQYLIGSQIALTSSHNGLKWVLWGATIKKGFSGDLVANSGAEGFAVDGIGTIDGQHGTFTGKGFVFSTSSTTNPYFGPGVKVTSFTDSHIEFGADSGQNAKILCDFLYGSGQTDFRAIHVNGPDTVACHRKVGPITIPLGYIDLDGAQSTSINGALLRRVEIDDDCAVTSVTGGSWGNDSSAITISGTVTNISNVRMAGAVTLAAGMTGSFVGNVQTVSGFTNSTSGGNVVVFHKDISTGTMYIGKSSVVAWPTGTERILSSRTANIGDNNTTPTVGSNAPVIIWNNTLTDNRTASISTTGAVTGDRFTFLRTGGGNFSANVGTGLAYLFQNGWCDVEYNGSAWIKTRQGSFNSVYTLTKSTTAVGNVGVGEDDLISLTAPPNLLNTNGNGIRIIAWGTTANNSNTKQVKLYCGSAILTTALTVSQAGKWRIEAMVFRTGTDAQDYVATLNEYGTTAQTDMENGTLTEDDGAAITVKCTGTVVDGGGGVNNNDIVQEGMLIEVLP